MESSSPLPPAPPADAVNTPPPAPSYQLSAKKKKSKKQRHREQLQRQQQQDGGAASADAPPPRKRSGGKTTMPENWDDVPKIGALIGDSRFVAMRVPLDAKFDHSVQPEEQLWRPQQFLEQQRALGLNVGLVVDLTNTFKYYDGVAEFADSGVEYAKLRIEGFNAPPRAHDVARFFEIVDGFLAQKPEAAIAVHCTHGLNRTGYLIVCFLVQRLQMTVTDALAAFAAARPPGLIKHMYVEDLYRRLGPNETVQLPELPAWASDKYSKRKHR